MDEHVVHRLLDRVGVDALRHRQVALRVHVDAQDAVALLDEGRRQVERGGRLRHAALLVGEGDDLGLAGHGETPRVGGRTIGPRFRARAAFSCRAVTMEPCPVRERSGLETRGRRQEARPGRPAFATSGAAGSAATTGLAHVATVSFLASRAAPSLQFFFALGGGIALARAAAQRGARSGYGAALASMLQTVAVMGPARDQRAAHAGDHRADDGPAAGARRAAADRVPRLPGAAARPLHGAARRVHLRDPRRAGRVHGLLRDAHGLAGDRPPGRDGGARGDGGGAGPVGDLLQRDPGGRLPARARRLAARRDAAPSRAPARRGGGRARLGPLRPARDRARRAARDARC